MISWNEGNYYITANNIIKIEDAEIEVLDFRYLEMKRNKAKLIFQLLPWKNDSKN